MTTVSILLQNIGYDRKTSLIMECLITSGSASAGLISKRTGVKRPTVYALLEVLIQSGEVTRQKKHGRSQFFINDAHQLVKNISRKAKVSFDEKVSAVSELSQFLKSLSIKEEVSFGDVIVERLKSAEEIYEKIRVMISSGEFYAIFNPNVTTFGKMKSINKEFLKETAIRKPFIKEIIVQGKEARWYARLVKNPNHYIKFLPEKTPFELDLIIGKDSFLLAQYGKMDENCISIVHKGFTRSMRTLFDIIWESMK